MQSRKNTALSTGWQIDSATANGTYLFFITYNPIEKSLILIDFIIYIFIENDVFENVFYKFFMRALNQRSKLVVSPSALSITNAIAVLP